MTNVVLDVNVLYRGFPRVEGSRPAVSLPGPKDVSISSSQIEGRLPSGESLHFRCRRTTCSLGIAPKAEDPVADPTLRQDVSRLAVYEAGVLEPEKAEALLRELHAAYPGYRAG